MPESGAAAVAAEPVAEAKTRPTLVFLYSRLSGHSRRAEGFLAQVLQRRSNHNTFVLRAIEYETHLELAARLGVEQPPAFVVIEDKRVRGRLEQPRGCTQITALLEPWLK
jgi:thioredoxin-like negative regulator of GroEL